MAGKQEYDLASFRRAIEEHAPRISAIAKAMNCTRGTVYSYLRRYPELQAAYDKAAGGSVAMVAAADDSRTAHSKEAVQAAINKSRGIKATVASALGCSRGTVDNYLKRWPELKELLDAERSGLISIASSALIEDLKNSDSKGHQPAYFFILKTLGKEEGFVERSEVSGPDGKGLFELPPDVVRLAEMIGFDWAAVGAQLARMITMQAEQKGLLKNGQTP
jgi:AcrR family transcriptional regulator